MAGEPREFGPYKLVRRLGVGGMAETFEATRKGAGGFEQRVCLKRVLPAFSDDEDFVARFQAEARLAARLRHTNIVGVIDAGVIDGARYMALELVDGVDLRSLLKSSPNERLSPDTVALIGMDLAFALEHAHGTLIHRDVSPSNVLVSRSGEAKLADFGIAKPIDNAQVTASRSAQGKIPYMAPERMRGESVDGRADLFSLGVLMFEAVAGVRPFDGAHDVETMQRVLDGNRLSLRETAPWAPARLREIIENLIEIEADARPQSADALLEALADVAPSPSTRRALARSVEQHRGGPAARLHVRAKEEERDTELTRLPLPASEPTSTRRKHARWIWLLSALLGAIATALLVASQLPMEAPSPNTPNPTPHTQAPTPEDTGADTGADAGADADAGAGADTGAVAGADTVADRAPARGFVRVVVQPWGNVWIDGKYLGRAPVKARLPKGKHVIEAGRELPAQKRIVRVQPGARKEIEITLGNE